MEQAVVCIDSEDLNFIIIPASAQQVFPIGRDGEISRMNTGRLVAYFCKQPAFVVNREDSNSVSF